jgi:methionyl-tRNA formyltransferase
MLNTKTNPKKLFAQVSKKSGWQYALYLVREIINYKAAIFIRKFFFLNNEYVLDTPSNLGKRFKISVSRLSGSINDESNLQRIKQLGPELIIAIRYAEILKKSVLSVPNKGVINIHPSLLPKYGGLTPVFHAMNHNEKDIGYTIHFMDESIDSGRIVKQEIIKQESGDSVVSLNIRIHIQAGYGLVSCMDKLTQTIVKNENSSYFSWADKADIKKFLKSGMKLIKLSDFTKLLFFSPPGFHSNR